MTDQPIDAGDFDDTDPAEASELLLLSALLWASAEQAAAVTELVEDTDFHKTSHATVFAVIADLAAAGPATPHRAESVHAELLRRGDLGDTRGKQLSMVLANAATAGASGIQARHYATDVVAAAYRRAYRAAADGIAHAADTLPEADLFEYMARHGRALRAHRDRLTHLRHPSETGTPTP